MKNRDKTTQGLKIRRYVNNLPTSTPQINYRDYLNVPVQSIGPIPKPLVPNNFRYEKLESYGFVGKLTEIKNSLNDYFVTEGLVYEALGLGAATSFPTPDRSLVYNEALDKLGQKVRGSLDLSVSAFEWRQSVQLAKNLSPAGLKNLASSIYNQYITRPLKSKGRWNSQHVNGDRYSDARIPADLWLQYQYGLRPLMQDVFDTALEAVRHADSGLILLEASVRKPFGGDVKHNFLNTGTNPNVFTGIRGLRGARICKFAVQLDIGVINSVQFQRFTSLNPVSIAWELIPYSFVVDWFIDVGTYLRLVETALLNKTAFRSGYSSELIYFEGQPEMEWSNQMISSYAWNGKVTGNIHYSSFERKKLSSYPLPAIPRFKTDLGSSQLLSAAALLSQFLPKEVIPITLNTELKGPRTAKRGMR